MTSEMVTQAPAAVVAVSEDDGVSARWSALRSAAARRGAARRLRREAAALRDALAEAVGAEGAGGEAGAGGAPPPLHTKYHLNRRIDELKERLSRLLEVRVSMLKLTVSARRLEGECGAAGGEGGGDAPGSLTGDLASLLRDWEQAHHSTSSELLSLERALAAWAEWEAGLCELTAALRSDQDALRRLQGAGCGGGGGAAGDAELRLLAEALGDKGGSTCGSLSDSGISDGDSEAAAAAAAASGARARRLAALRELARALQAQLAPGSHALRNITKRMEQAESEMRALHESCRALAARAAHPTAHPAAAAASAAALAIAQSEARARASGGKTGSGDPDYTPAPRHWAWRALRSALPIQLCLVALLVAAWLLGRPRCCDLLNTLGGSLAPQLRYVRGPPPT